MSPLFLPNVECPLYSPFIPSWRLETRSRSQRAAFAALCALMCVCFALALRVSWHELNGLLAWTLALVGALALLANPHFGDERVDR